MCAPERLGKDASQSEARADGERCLGAAEARLVICEFEWLDVCTGGSGSLRYILFIRGWDEALGTVSW